MKRVDIGGQAVIEGVMMKNKDRYAIAIRKPDQEIIIDKKEYKSFTKRIKVFGFPIIRGVVNFIEALVIGMKILTYSAEFYDTDEQDEQSKFEKWLENKFGEKKIADFIIGLSVLLSIVFSIGLFFLLPLGLSQLLKPFIDNVRLLNIIDGVIRIMILLGYMAAISLMKDIQRVFQYHGAEHKTIATLEHEEELTIENVKKHSRFHKRCGTNFIFIVVLISVLILTLFSVETFWMRLLVRIGMLPIIAGISYEVLRLLGKFDNKFFDIVSMPGLALQRLTTREPDESQIEVAIESVKAVLNVNVEEETEEVTVDYEAQTTS